MKLPSHVGYLAKSLSYTPTDLVKAAYQFAELDDDQRRYFYDERMRIIAMGEPVESQQMRTSGFTNGQIVRYKWGPNFSSMSEFFDVMKFEGLGRCRVFFTKVLPGMGDDEVFSVPSVSSYDHYVMNIDASKAGSMRWLRTMMSASGGERVVISGYPTLVRDLLLSGVKLSDIPADGAAFYFTGSPVGDAVDVVRSHGLDARDAMRCWDGGATFFTCRYGSKHWIDLVARVAVSDGRLASTDVFNAAQVFSDYENGDALSWSRGPACRCGLPVDDIKFEDRDQNILVDGEAVPYRKVESLFSGFTDFIGKRTASLQVGVHPEARVVKMYYVLEDGSELDADHRGMLATMLKESVGCLGGVDVKIVMGYGASNMFKRFPVSYDRSVVFEKC